MEKSYPENAKICRMNKMETLSVILRHILSLQSYTEYLFNLQNFYYLFNIYLNMMWNAITIE